MSRESVPPKGLLERIEELMTAPNAHLSALEDPQAAGAGAGRGQGG
ncbi:hypothetical protein ACWD5V_12440 [Streptomyces sp. NPDC002523]